jgi:hypothetical protein
MARRPTTTSNSRAIRAGFRSGLEETIAQQLHLAGVPFEYEPDDGRIAYTVPASGHQYSPDFDLRGSRGFIVETKGIFDVEDRKKHLLIKEQHPELDIRFVFSNPHTPLTKGTKVSAAEFKKWLVQKFKRSTGFTKQEREHFRELFLKEVKPRGLTYATWSDRHGFKWAAKTIPEEWLK